MAAERTALIGLLALSTGCGSLVDGTYRGEPLFTITGQVYTEGLSAETEVGVALLWSWGSGGLESSSQEVVVETSFPARYEIEVFSAPDEALLTEFLSEEDVFAAVGDIVIFEDTNLDGEWSPEHEGLVGGSFDRSILWIEPEDRDLFLRDHDASLAHADHGETDLLNELPGFHLVFRDAPFSCTAPWDQFLEIADDRRADLDVGYYFPSVFDWDCDGFGDQPPPLSGDECMPDEQVVQCEFIAEVLSSFEQGQDEVLVQELAFITEEDVYFAECLELGCPELVDALYDAAEAAAEPPTKP